MKAVAWSGVLLVRDPDGPGPTRCPRPSAYVVSAARVMLVVSLLSHSEAAKASLIFSRGYLWEMMRSQGQRAFVRTRKSRARGMIHGSYWMTPRIFFEPHTRSDGSSSILAPRLIVPISRYVPPERS